MELPRLPEGRRASSVLTDYIPLTMAEGPRVRPPRCADVERDVVDHQRADGMNSVRARVGHVMGLVPTWPAKAWLVGVVQQPARRRLAPPPPGAWVRDEMSRAPHEGPHRSSAGRAARSWRATGRIPSATRPQARRSASPRTGDPRAGQDGAQRVSARWIWSGGRRPAAESRVMGVQVDPPIVWHRDGPAPWEGIPASKAGRRPWSLLEGPKWRLRQPEGARIHAFSPYFPVESGSCGGMTVSAQTVPRQPVPEAGRNPLEFRAVVSAHSSVG
jgi:hypothetical protein